MEGVYGRYKLIYLLDELDDDYVKHLIQTLTHTNIYFNDLKRFVNVQKGMEDILKEFIIIKDKEKKGVKCLVTNIDRAVKYDASGLFVYRRRNNYIGSPQKISCDGMWSVIDALETAGLIDVYIGYVRINEDNEYNNGMCSFITFKPELMNMFSKGNRESVKYGDNDVIDIIDRNKTKETNQRVKKETRRVAGVADIKQTLVQFNNRLAKTVFHLNGTPLPPPIYKRVFTDSLDLGGRYYSIDGRYQCVGQDIRKHLFIDNEAVCELDFSALHPSICYTLTGIEMEKGFKPYECDTSFLNVDYDEIEAHKLKHGLEKYDPIRSICKQALLCSINAQSLDAAYMAVAYELSEDSKRSDDKKKYKGIKKPFAAKQLCQSLCDHNYKIAHYFFSDSGIVLQNVDSRMAGLVINDFLVDGEVLLPYHDSFIAKVSLCDKLEESMTSAYKSILGTTMNCKIDRKY